MAIPYLKRSHLKSLSVLTEHADILKFKLKRTEVFPLIKPTQHSLEAAPDIAWQLRIL